jgi:serine/threonine-protein kinase
VSDDIPDRSSDPRIGTRIDDYAVTGFIGMGGMGEVYRATGPDGVDVALKMVRSDAAREETFRRRFVREANIAQTVKHPNVVAVVATGELDGLPYMVQEFIDGLSLEERLARDHVLDVATTVAITADVAAGLEAVWAAGMVHRDVKPANILLDADGRAHITDFGLAKDTQGSMLTLPGQALGSLDYMSPEQVEGEEVSAASDIYALGCVAYECACGKPPFSHLRGTRVMWGHLQDDPPDPLMRNSELPEPFAEAILVALNKEPSDRPHSAGEYARLLAQAAAA